MGVVYVAEQTEPVRRKVALKLIKRGMDTEQVVARFEADLDDPAFDEILRDDWERAQECGVRRMPTFVVNGRLVTQGEAIPGMRALVDTELAAASTFPP